MSDEHSEFPDVPDARQDAPEPGETPSEPPPQRTGRRLALALWLVLLLLVAAMVGLQVRASMQPQTLPGVDAGDDTSELRLLSRYAVGVKTMLGGLATGSDASIENDLLEAVRAEVQTEKDQIRVTCVQAVVINRDTAAANAEQLALMLVEDAVQGDAVVLTRILRDDRSVSPEVRREFRNDYGWYADLALHAANPNDASLQDRALSPAWRVAITLWVAIVALLGGGLLGLVLIITAIVFAMMGKLRSALASRRPPSGPSTVLLETFVIFLAALIGMSTLIGLVSGLFDVELSTHLLWVTLLIALWPLLRGIDRRDWRRAIGWHTGRNAALEIGCGIVGYLAGLPIFLLGVAIVVVITQITGAEPTHPIIKEMLSGDDAGWKIASLYLLACAWAPIVEETFFRGAFYGHLRQRWYILPAAIVSASVFAIIHPFGWISFPALGAIGLNLALIREWRGSLIAPITAHAVHNGLVLTFAIMVLGG